MEGQKEQPKPRQVGIRHLLIATAGICVGMWMLRQQLYGPPMSFPETALYGIFLIAGSIGSVGGRLYWGTNRGAKLGFWIGCGIVLYLIVVLNVIQYGNSR